MKLRYKNSYTFTFILLIINITIFSNCNSFFKNEDSFKYTMNDPVLKIVLKKNLKEVSGISFISDNEVCMIDDEEGAIFYYNLKSNAVNRKILFSKDGDFEDLKIVEDTAYIIRSDGKLFVLKNIKEPNSGILEYKYNTGLTKKNNTEGICYDDKKKLLFIACKDSPGNIQKYKNQKAIYSFNPQLKLLSDTPVFLIDINEIEKRAFGNKINVVQKILRFYQKSKRASFEPSAIAIHPVTREVYVLSSVGRLLVVLNPNGKIKHVIKLSPSVFKQPEGIAFDSASNLFITNEGRNGKANILKFEYLSN